MLTSPHDPKAKYFVSLKTRKSRKPDGKFIVEGIHLADEAHKAGLLDKVIYSDRVLRTEEGRDLVGLIASDIQIEQASDKIINFLSDVETPQGIIASARPKTADIGALFEVNDPLIVVACGIQDPGNLGTIIRTADAAGCAGVVVSKGSVDPYNDKVVRSSAGSIFHLNIVKYDDIIELVSALKRRGIRVISSVVGAERSHYEADFRKASAILIGSESQGLPADVRDVSDEFISIPMPGAAESLNAAVSCAVILYEALRQRRSDAGKTG